MSDNVHVGCNWIQTNAWSAMIVSGRAAAMNAGLATRSFLIGQKDRLGTRREYAGVGIETGEGAVFGDRQRTE
jgi:hypothetical protein